MCQITGIEFEFEHERYKIYLMSLFRCKISMQTLRK